VIYLIMPDRFANGDASNDDPPQSRGLWDRRKGRFYHGGDLQGVIDRVPYLENLGITGIWLNPVYDNPNHVDPGRLLDGEPVTHYHGYGAVDFYAVDEHLGDVAKFRELVEAAHRHGIKVTASRILEVVPVAQRRAATMVEA
jgi:glycosidase